MQNKELDQKIAIHQEFLNLHFGNRFMVDLPLCIYDNNKYDASFIKSLWKQFTEIFPNQSECKVLNFYIHIPYCVDRCSYCHYGSEKLTNTKFIDDYIIKLIKYFEYFEGVFKKTTFTNLYIGGGTPNILSVKQLDFLFTELFNRFKFDPEGEKTLEGDPRCSSFNKLKLLKKYGFNRVSFGVQSFNQIALKHANRINQEDIIVKKAIIHAKKAGFACINIDMIMGLYGEGELFIDSFKKALQLEPYSISIYPLQATNEYLKKFFNSDKNQFLKYRQGVLKLVIKKMLKEAEELNYNAPDYSNLYLPMTNSGALTFINKKISLLKHKNYVVDSASEPISCFGVGEKSISKFNGRSFVYQADQPITLPPEEYKYSGSFYTKKIQMSEYITRMLSHRKLISKQDFKKIFNADLCIEFKNELRELKKLGQVSIDKDNLYFLPIKDMDRKLYALFFHDFNLIQKRVQEHKKDIPIINKIKKTVIIAGYACNNNCVFCIHGNKRDYIHDKDTNQIKKEIARARSDGSTYLEIIGGETSMRPDIFELISFARDIGFKTIMMATNGRMYSYKNFTYRILKSGLNSLVFSIHGHNAKLHDELTQVPGSFNQLIQGYKNIKTISKELNIPISLGSNTCITKQNYEYLPQIGQYIHKLGINNSEFIFIDPNQISSSKLFNSLVPKISKAAPYIHKCLDIKKKNKLSHWHVRYVPLCYFKDYQDQISEIMEDKIFHTEHIAPDFYNPNASEGRKNVGRIKTDKCNRCELFNQCEGIWNKYNQYYGDKELKPIISNLDLQEVNNMSLLDIMGYKPIISDKALIKVIKKNKNIENQ